jgi:hypothetical protein
MAKKKGHYRFRNKELKTSRYKVDDIPVNGWNFPTDLIYPMVEGPSVQPFEFSCGNNYHIIPYRKEDTLNPIPLKELVKEQKDLAIYFANHKDLLDKQSDKSKDMHRGEEFYALSKIGPYTFAPYLVAARDNSKFCASVVKPTLTPWGELKQSICVKHTIIISQDKYKRFITEDEAHYINGILNSTIVIAYIHSTFKTNGFSLNKSNLFLPKYQEGNELYTRIVNLSKEATKNSDRREFIQNELTNAYLALCEYWHAKSNFNNLSPIIRFNLKHDEEQLAAKAVIAAESRPVYNESILIGGYKGEDQLNWISENGRYNVRAIKRRGAIKSEGKAEMATSLLLYDIDNPEIYWYFALSRTIDSADENVMASMGYPRIKKGHSYFLYYLTKELNCPKINVQDVIQKYKPEHWTKGAPIYLPIKGDIEKL